ncbi:MAG: tyrosine-type recombinase/integrase [Planctomycetota bacterium]|nr:tyrosine-type recombinase/integrase [Planctomycetota bacterium]
MTKKRRRGNGQGTLFKRDDRSCWIARWYDHAGKRQEQSTRTTDKAAAERILKKRVADVALRRDGVIDPRQDRYSIEGRKPLTDHIADYIAHCRRAGQAPHHVDQKERHLDRMMIGCGATRLADLTADALERHLGGLGEDDLSARSINFARQIAVAFMSWCFKTGRSERNPLTVVPRLDERKDRRRVRRSLTDDEMVAQLAVAEPRGRKAWYLAAVLAGLRKGDLQRLIWTDVDFDAGTIAIPQGKAKRCDLIPMHPQLADVLKRRCDASMAMPKAKVFPQTVTDLTRLKDFLRAGLAHEVIVRDTDGKPVMIGKGKRERPKTRIETIDEDGRVIDLHAMRTTLGTNLARAGVAPQIAQRIMRHSDYRTTLRHYTVLGLTDTTKAVAACRQSERLTKRLRRRERAMLPPPVAPTVAPTIAARTSASKRS